MATFNIKTGEYSIPLSSKQKRRRKIIEDKDGIFRALHETAASIQYTGSFFKPRAKQVVISEALIFKNGEYIIDNNVVDDVVDELIDDVEIEQNHQKQLQESYSKYINAHLVKKIVNGKRVVSEVVPKGVYEKALMVELSYEIQDAQTTADLKEAGELFDAQVKNDNLRFIPKLSSRQCAVVYNIEEHKLYVAFHGANDASGIQTDRDMIKQVVRGTYHSHPEMVEAERQFKTLLEYANRNEMDLNVVGYSLGGHKSLYLGEKYNVEGVHLNPFTNPFVKHDLPRDVNLKPQSIIRIVDDPTTIHSVIRPPHTVNRRYGHVLPVSENTSHLDGHGLHNFTSKKPRSIDNVVDGKQNIKGEALGHVATFAGFVAGGYSGYQEGKNNSGELSEELYRGTLGATESTLPIVGEDAIVESGMIGFTKDELKHTFHFIKTLFTGPDKPNEVPEGYVQVWGEVEQSPPEAESSSSTALRAPPSPALTRSRARFNQPMN